MNSKEVRLTYGNMFDFRNQMLLSPQRVTLEENILSLKETQN